MKLYIWRKNFLTGYSSGVGIVLAHSEDEARAIGRASLAKEIDVSDREEFMPPPNEVIELTDPRAIAILWGGD